MLNLRSALWPYNSVAVGGEQRVCGHFEGVCGCSLSEHVRDDFDGVQNVALARVRVEAEALDRVVCESRESNTHLQKQPKLRCIRIIY